MGANFDGTMIVTIPQLRNNGRIFFRTGDTISSGYALQSSGTSGIGTYRISRGSGGNWALVVGASVNISGINNVIAKIVVSTSATNSSVTINVYIGPDKILPSAPSITYIDNFPYTDALWGLGSLGNNGATYDNFSISTN